MFERLRNAGRRAMNAVRGAFGRRNAPTATDGRESDT